MNFELTHQELTKSNIAQTGSDYAKQLLNDGNLAPLAEYIRLKAIGESIKAAMSELKTAAIDEAGRYGRDDSTIGGVKFAVRSGRDTYSYTHDAMWNTIKSEEKSLAADRVKREGFLRTMETEMADPLTGEIISPAFVSKYGEEVLAITFPK